jgi:hypothetical protein
VDLLGHGHPNFFYLPHEFIKEFYTVAPLFHCTLYVIDYIFFFFLQSLIVSTTCLDQFLMSNFVKIQSG